MGLMRKCILVLLLIIIINDLNGQDTERLSRPDLPGDLLIDIGFNFVPDMPDTLDIGFWGSKSLGLYYSRYVPLFGKLSFHPALGLGLEKYNFRDDNVTLGFDDENQVIPVDISPLEPAKSKLAITYLDFQAEFRFYPKGTDRGDGFFIGAGGSAGLRLASHTKVNFEDDGNLVKEKTKRSFNLSVIRYSAHGRVGWRGINFFYKAYLSNLFDAGEAPLNENSTTFTIGLSLNGF